MQKVSQLSGYLMAAVSGSAAILLLVAVVLKFSWDDGLVVSAIWVITLLLVLTVSELVTTCRIGWAIGVFIEDLRGIPDTEDEPAEEELVRVDETARTTSIDREKLNKALVAIVTRYHEGKSMGRASCVTDGACDQRHWNLANAVLQAVGLREAGNTAFFSTGKLEVDVQVALHGWYLAARGHELWITANGSRDKLDLVEADYLQAEKVTGPT